MSLIHTEVNSIEYITVTEWEKQDDGYVYGYNSLGDEVIAIDAPQDRYERIKWGDKYTPGRHWYIVLEDGTTTYGFSKDLRAAKKDAAAELAKHAKENQ